MSRKVLITGANGMLASDLIPLLQDSDFQVYPYTRKELDISNPDSVDEAMDQCQPDVLINCAAYTQVDKCETETEKAFQVNRDALAHLVKGCRRYDTLLVHISTDYVFDGRQKTPYHEGDPTHPLSVYGQSKLEGEQTIVDSYDSHLILRASWLYGILGHSFVKTIIRIATERETLNIVNDQFGSPTHTINLSKAIIHLLERNAKGLYHYSDDGICSWYDFACEIIEEMKSKGFPLAVKEVNAIATSEYPLPAVRPQYSLLSKEKYKGTTGLALPHWKDGLKDFFNRYKH